MKNLSDTSKVEAQDVLSIATVVRAYGSVYNQNIAFDFAALGIGNKSWLRALLRDVHAESCICPVDDEPLRNLRLVIVLLAGNREANRLLGKPARRTAAADIRRLFQLSEELAGDADTATLARGRMALRSFFFARAHAAPFAEPIDQQRVRFRPKLPFPKGDPRPLISDLHEIADPKANVPIGALAATTAKEIAVAVRERAKYDLERIQSACIADMTAAVALRKRAKELRLLPVAKAHLASIREKMEDSRTAGHDFSRNGVAAELVLRGVLKTIHAEKLATSSGKVDRYDVPLAHEVRRIFLDGMASFKSQRLLEIEYRASVEELFAAFHLLQTHTGWNWSAVSSLRADEIDLKTPGMVVFQSFKSKTGDATPVRSIDLSEPGVQMAIEILLWNREQLVKCGFLDRSEQGLWATRPRRGSKQRAGYFHPVLRLKDFIERHALPGYSLEQIRNQVLFSVSLSGGGIEAARFQGGHKSYQTTQRYVGNIVQDRISSALNLEYSKRLETEIRYLYRGGARNAPEIKLLKPIGDGSSCSDSDAPPPGRSKTPGSCSAESCHANGGCPNRRIAIDDRRVEEVLRLNLHYTKNWQRLMQANPERFVVHTLPRMIFNAALLLALHRGPYAARVMHVTVKIGMP